MPGAHDARSRHARTAGFRSIHFHLFWMRTRQMRGRGEKRHAGLLSVTLQGTGKAFNAPVQSRCSWCGPTSGNPASCWLRSTRAPATVRPPAGPPRSRGPRSPAAGFRLVRAGDDLKARDRARNLDPAGQKPTDRKCIERPQGPPTDGLEHRSRMCFCSAE
jgi:hypothetical protein